MMSVMQVCSKCGAEDFHVDYIGEALASESSEGLIHLMRIFCINCGHSFTVKMLGAEQQSSLKDKEQGTKREEKMLDLQKEIVEVQIRSDSKVVWVNVPNCVLRICGIQQLILKDDRR